MADDSIKTGVIFVRADVAALSAYDASRAQVSIWLDANEGALDVPSSIKELALRELLQSPWNSYPDAAASALRDSLAKFLEAEPAQLVLGVGSDECIVQLLQTVQRSDAERRVLVLPVPTFSMYAMSARIAGWDLREVPLDDSFDLDLESMQRAIAEERASLVFFASPNNPTGNAFDLSRMEALIVENPKTLFVLDRAYGAYDSKASEELFVRHPNLILMGTLSKIGLAGLRLGFLRAHEGLAIELNKVRLPYNVPTPTQVLARVILDQGADWLREQGRAIAARRESFSRSVRAIEGFFVGSSNANFVLVSRRGMSGNEFRDAMLKRGIAIKSFGQKPRLESFVRISIGTDAEMQSALEAMQELAKTSS